MPSRPADTVPSLPTDSAVDSPGASGLRSVRGIRWLLLVGALVVVVSLVRLVAEGWGAMSPPLQFLLLCLGNLGIYGAGEIAHRRLRLPTASGALFGLFAVALPVLSWGAGRGGLLDTWAGRIAFVLGSAAAVPASGRLLRIAYGYRGVFLPACGALFLLSLGILSTFRPATPWIPAVVLGLLLVAVCRRVNRFFFHRDRVRGVDSPLHAVPFGAFVTLYLANLAVVATAASTWALALLFVAVALVEAGEEYFRAVSRLTGDPDGPWPRRSRGLLAVGFATGAVAVALSWLAGDAAVLVAVTGAAAARLVHWSFRYGRTASYAVGLPLALVALHASPALFTGLRDRFVEQVSAHFGFQGLAGAASAAAAGELSLLAVLVLGAAALRHQALRASVTPEIVTVHAVCVAGLGAWNLALSLVGVEVMAQVAPAVAVATAAAAWTLRRSVPLPVTHLATLVGAYGLLGSGPDFSARLLVLAAINALSIGVWASVYGPTPRPAKDRFLSLCGPLGSTPILALWAVGVFLATSPPRFVEVLWTLILAVVPWLVAALRLGLPRLAATAGATIFAGLHLLVVDAAGHDVALGFDAVALAVLGAVARRRIAGTVTAALRGGALAALWIGSLWTVAALLEGPGSAVGALFLAVAAAYLLDSGLAGRGKRSLHLGLLYLAAVPGTFAAFLWPDLADARAQAAFFVAALCLVRRRIDAPAGIYRLERLYGALGGDPADAPDVHGERPAASRRLSRAADTTFHAVARGACLAALLLTGPWMWTLLGVLLLDAWDTRRRVDGPSEPPVSVTLLAGIAWVHGVLAGGGEPSLVENSARVLAAGPDPLFALRTLAATGLWRLLVRFDPRPSVRRVSLLLEAVSLAIALGTLPSGPLGAATLVAVGAFVIDHGRRAWRKDDAVAAWAAQTWGVALGIGIVELGAFDLSLGWKATLAVALAFVCRVARESLETGRPGIAATLVPTGTAAAVIGGLWPIVTASGLGWSPSLPAFGASLYFALDARRPSRFAVPSGIGAALLFVAGFFHLAPALPFFGVEAHLTGPGLALLGTAFLLRPRLDPTWTDRLVTLGAGCLYAVPTLALLRSLDWGQQIVLLLLAVGFGALSFRLQSRSLLLLSTGAVVVDLGFFLLKIGRTEPTLLWVAGLVFGLGLMAVAGYLESRRELALQRVRLWGHHLRAWR